MALLPVPVQAQGVSIITRVDQTTITIGDRINLEIIVTADTTLQLVLPPTEDLLSVFEVKDYQTDEPLIDQAGRRVYRSWFNLTTWTTGRWLIPPLTVTFTDSSGQSGSASSDSLFIEVNSILATAGADTVDIRDLKPPFRVPAKRAWYYYTAAGIVLLLLFGWWWLRRRRRADEIEVRDTRTPDERAFDELRQLRATDALVREHWREWYFALTEIFRRYLDRRYGVETLEATTTEVKQILVELPLGETGQQETTEFLEFADLVKFARLIPPAERPDEDFNWVWRFVEQTKIEALLTVEDNSTSKKTGTAG